VSNDDDCVSERGQRRCRFVVVVVEPRCLIGEDVDDGVGSDVNIVTVAAATPSSLTERKEKPLRRTTRRQSSVVEDAAVESGGRGGGEDVASTL